MEQNLVTERLNLIQEHRGVDCFMSHLLKGIDYPPLTSSANAQENGGEQTQQARKQSSHPEVHAETSGMKKPANYNANYCSR
jgi:hypothetical protein